MTARCSVLRDLSNAGAGAALGCVMMLLSLRCCDAALWFVGVVAP